MVAIENSVDINDEFIWIAHVDSMLIRHRFDGYPYELAINSRSAVRPFSRLAEQPNGRSAVRRNGRTTVR